MKLFPVTVHNKDLKEQKRYRRLILTVLGCTTVLSACFSNAVTVCRAEPPGHSTHRSVPEHPMERAGNPLCIAPWARCFPSSKYKGYYVGGGAAMHGHEATAFRGEGRYVHEGTFGVDYAPWYSRVQTRWFHDRKQQGGEGQYESDRHNNPLDDHWGFGRFKKAPRLFHQ